MPSPKDPRKHRPKVPPPATVTDMLAKMRSPQTMGSYVRPPGGPPGPPVPTMSKTGPTKLAAFKGKG